MMRKFPLLFVLLGLCGSRAHAMKLFVAPYGNDAWTGQAEKPNATKSSGPFATLERARDEIRRIKGAGELPKGGITVELRAGTYALKHSFDLEARDSGTDKAPIEYRARAGEQVRIIGGQTLDGWKAVTDEKVLARLDASARGHVLQVDLRALGLTDLPGVQAGNWGQSQPGVELFDGANPMTLARWPNEGFVKIGEVQKPEGDKGASFTYEGDRPSRWVGESEVWMEGYWAYDWADQRLRAQSIDPEKHTITLGKPDNEFGYRKGQWYYAFNLLSELDQPGEWYLDRPNGLLYFWPPSPLKAGEVSLSMLPNLVTMQDVSHVTLSKLTLEVARGTAVTVKGGSEVRLSGCTIRNVGSWAVHMENATQSGVEGCDIYQTGDGGVDLIGGDRKTLTPSGLYADNNHIHHYSRWNPVYKAGVRVQGVGCRVSHNLIHDAPHMAIGFSGNDHLIEFNEIHSVCYESNDAGIMYAGRNWSMRGNVIRNNYLHHVYGFEGKGCAGVYLDDNFSSATIEGNIFYQVPKAAFIGGGRDNTVANNVFVDCDPALLVDARGLGWRSNGLEELTASLKDMPYQSELWRDRYPGIVNTLEDEPMAPKGNVIERNIFAGGRKEDIEGKARPYLTFKDNFEGDPLFVDRSHGNFQLRGDSPAFKLGFKKIPVEKIGVYRDGERASWPVVSVVRGKPGPMVQSP